jgi:nitrilase
MRSVKAAAVQLSPVLYSREGTVNKIVRKIHALAREGVQFATFPVASVGINERDGGTLYNTQLLFDADGTLIQRRRKITPTYHERMIWGQGDGSGLRAVDSEVGRIGQLACWEHYNPLG